MSDSLASGAKFWTCRCGVSNSEGAHTCIGCGDHRSHPRSIPPTRHKLKQHRQPNDTERSFGLILEAMKQRGDIVYYGFEEITLRFADMSYTPDYFVIRRQRELTIARAFDIEPPKPSQLIEAVYVELKGAHKWEDSIIKFKAARARFTWAQFQLWHRLQGNWEQIA